MGVILKAYSDYQVVTCLITNGCTGTSGNVTMTLDGTGYNTAVVNGDTKAQVATKMAATSYGANWTVKYTAGAEVLYFRYNTISVTKTYSFSGGSTGVTATTSSVNYNNKDNTPGFSYDCGSVKSDEEEDSCNLDIFPMPMMGSDMTMVMDYEGVQRDITLSVDRVDGEGSLDNDDFVTNIRALMVGTQNIIGPFRLTKSTSIVTAIPQETTHVYIKRFRWRYDNDNPKTLSVSLQLVRGT